MKASDAFPHALRDGRLAEILQLEAQRQLATINLIASENHASRAVLEAQSSVLNDKYAEGYPERRYYGGCVHVDEVESTAIERAKALFGAGHANVQPHSGSQANMAAYMVLLEHGDTVMGMSKREGGHLTHGSGVNFSGRWYNFAPYAVDRDTETLDYDEIRKLALSHSPKLIVAGASAYPRIIDFGRFRRIADEVGATLLADIAHIAGIVAAKLHPSPVGHAHIVSATTQKTLRGPRGGLILCGQDLASKVDSAVFPGIQGGPAMHIIAAKAICFYEAMQPEFAEYQRSVLNNARTLASELERHGMRIVSGGTDNHIVLVDLSRNGITGRRAEEALEAAGILANRNAIPYDPLPPLVASGIRFGTAAVTTRGFGTPEMKQLASLIIRILASLEDGQVIERSAREVRDLCRRFPIPATA